MVTEKLVAVRYTARKSRLLRIYTANYKKVPSGYMGQLVEWPEVITEGETLEDCRDSLQDAFQEMVAGYRQLGKYIPAGNEPG